MSQARSPVSVVYACGLVTAGLILFLLIYSGIFDGIWDVLIDLVKDIARFFWE
jgi:hypothetical protein